MKGKIMSNTNSTKLENCDYCDSCYYCNSCDSCNSCNYCDSCNSCNSCDYCNYCNSCKGLRMSERMLFCLGEGKYETKGAGYQKNNQIFNTQVTPEEWDKAQSSLPEIKIGLTKWVDKKDMSDDEKKNKSGWETTGGYLKRYSYEEAWATWWSEASKKDKDSILNLPHFNREIFKGITGIEISESSNPREIQINGATYVLKD